MSPLARRDPASLPALLDGLEPFEALVGALGRRGRISAGGLWGSSQALVLARLAARVARPLVAVASTDAEAEAFAQDLATLGAGPELFPASDEARRRPASEAARGRGGFDPESVRRRLQVAQRLAGPAERRPRLVVAPLLSLLQPVPSPRDLEQDFLHLARGARLDAEDVLGRLVAAGYSRQPLAESPGEVSLRGDILDVFPFAAELPVRIELFDDAVESVRVFDPDTQRSVEELERIDLLVAADAGGVEDGRGIPPASLLGAETGFVLVEPLRIADQAEGFRIRSSAHARALAELSAAEERRSVVELRSLPGDLGFDTRSVQGLGVGIQAAPEALRAAAAPQAPCADAAKRSEVLVLCRNEGEEHRFREVVDERGGADGVATAVGGVARGFRLPAAGLVVVNHSELLGIEGARGRRRERPAHRVRALQSFFELRVGDLVVHAVHGLARYAGLVRMERGGGEEEHLHLHFADDVSLYVPASRIDLVQRYVGGGGAAPSLDKVGGASFRRRKEKVERAIVDLAAELLEVQARREMQERPRWRPDPELVRELVASFPHEDTGDQAAADREVEADLEGAKPMDRLLCGDVGFGKTELAVRAAFRVVSGGGQVAVLVPTTVLARQHHATFRERLADFPVEVALLSRQVGGAEEREVLERVEKGAVDVLVGTHRILSSDVRFARLGLIVVDEEQRFGVKHKEHFKRLRADVDLLTLSATPIPRTLHMSLSGLRDISALAEPPPGRQEIETRLAYKDDHELVREALLREKNRGGQVFFLHNRVQSIERRARELSALVPESSYAIGHGQMRGRQLDRVMDSFTRGEVDVLVATTIIENGIDIPSAGTIVVDDADHFGLSELHQLRGRVGRGAHKAHCYLLVDPSRPVPQPARERLKALEELTRLGAGFQISMKDLELRGAGNLLGPEQSGHIAAIGYDMYCRLLEQTVARMRAGGAADELVAGVPAEVAREIEARAVELELGIDAYLPKEWIPTADARIEILRRLAAVETDAEADEELAALRDRFGRVPAEAEALVRQFRLRPRLAALGVRRLAWRAETYLVEYDDRVALERALAGAELRILERGRAHLVVPAGRRRPAAALAWIEELCRRALGDAGEGSGGLQGAAGAPRMRPARARQPRS